MRTLCIWLLINISFQFAFAIDVEKNPLKIEQVHQTILAKVDQPVRVILYTELPPKYHGYLDTVTVRPLNMPESKVNNLSISPVIQFYDKFSKKERTGFVGKSELKFDVVFSPIPKMAKGTLEFELKYQACTDEFCLLPQTKTFVVPYASLSVDVENRASIFDFKNKNTFLIFLIVFVGGLLTSLTPCIFPMIPITLSILGARASGRTKKKSFLISLVYVFGISVTYSTLGYLAAKTGTLFGSTLNKPSVVLGIAFIFYTMALSFFGVFEVQIPLVLQNRLNKFKFNQGFVGAFFYGLVAGLVASPCVGPVLVSILAYVAQSGNPALGMLLLFTYAFGMGMLFIVLGTFTHVLNKIPKSGPWMETVKFIFGVSLISVALYYIHGAFPQRVFWGFVAFSLILISSLHGALDDIKTLSPRLKLRKWFMASFFVLGFALGSKVLFTQWNDKKTDSDQYMLFRKFSEVELEKALARGQPVVIDFFADWCAACHELDKFTFSDPTVKAQLQKYLLLKVDATAENDEISQILTKFRVVGLPTVIFYDSKGVWRKELTLTGFESAEDFLKRLEKL